MTQRLLGALLHLTPLAPVLAFLLPLPPLSRLPLPSDDKDPLWWALIGLDYSTAKPRAVVHAEGGSSLADMQTHLSDDSLMFGCFKVNGVDTRGAIVSTR
jgi:hypothetical protein